MMHEIGGPEGQDAEVSDWVGVSVFAIALAAGSAFVLRDLNQSDSRSGEYPVLTPEND